MPYTLYIHIPYCLVKCPYCDFNAYAARTWPEEQYVDALGAELRHYMAQARWQDKVNSSLHRLETIYFGGGTPSLFAPASIARFLDGVASLCVLASDLEVTLEADPATITREKLADYRAIGVNRLSLGVQSFQPQLLKTLGRLHSAEDARRVLTWARESGFDNVSLDLMFAVPGQTMVMVKDDLQQACVFRPEHISLYGLTYEENTPFFAMKRRGQLQPVDEDEEVAMYTLIQEQCENAGYMHYEISNFARPGFASRHNTHYWTGASYLGVGAGAHSFLNTPGWGTRWSNEKSPRRYVEKVLASGEARSAIETLTREQAIGEFVFLNLRQLSGFRPETFVERFGINFRDAFPQVANLCAEGLLREEAGRIKLTPQGLLIADTIFASFF